MMYWQVPVMDKAGRRLLLLVPMVAMVLILALITIALKLQVLTSNKSVATFHLNHVNWKALRKPIWKSVKRRPGLSFLIFVA